MSVAALIADMVRAGVDAEIIGRTAALLAAKDSTQGKDEQAERRRAADRERKRLRNSAESAESAEMPSPLVPPLEGFPKPLPKTPPIIPPSDTSLRSVSPAPKANSSKSHFDFDDEIDERLIEDWKAVRKAKRSGPITETVMAGMRREAAKAGISVSEAVRLCGERGWQGFQASYVQNARAGPDNRPPRTANDYLASELRKINNANQSDRFDDFDGITIDARAG